MTAPEPIGRPALTRSPVFVLTLVLGCLIAATGWVLATSFERSMVALSADIADAVTAAPGWIESVPAFLTSTGALGAFVFMNGWLLTTRRFRRLALTLAATVVAAAASITSGVVLLEVQRPSIRRLFEDLPDTAPRLLPTDPAVAAFVAALVLVWQWLPARSRGASFALAGVWISAGLAVAGAPPFLGIVLDVGVGLVVGSLVGLAFKTPNLQPDRGALISALGSIGIEVRDLHEASVDARGSVPWLGTTADGRAVFVKALSNEQRSADLLFRAVRWIRLRRTGDAPPEASAQRAVEHEALIAHHARSIGVATPRLLGVAVAGEHHRVALAYEGLEGRSLDRCDSEDLTDEIVVQAWEQLLVLRTHGVAHRDLRLANLFLDTEGQVLLVDFGFAELAASQQLLDTDVAELLAATGAAIGAERAVDLALAAIGRDVLDAARDWLHPLALSRATRTALRETSGLEDLRARVDAATEHMVTEYEPLGRFSASRLIGLGLVGLGVYFVLALASDADIGERFTSLEWDLVLVAVALSAATPMLRAMAYRAATGGRMVVPASLRAGLAAQTPVASPTSWAFANRIYSDAARDGGLSSATAKQAAAMWTAAGLVTAPLLVAGSTSSALRISQGYLVGIVLGLLAGSVVLAAEVFLLLLGPSAKELARVWMHPLRRSVRGSSFVRSMGWWFAAHAASGVSFVAVVRAAGVETEAGLLIAIWLAANSVASLLPAPGGIGAVELTAYALLEPSSDATTAAVAIIAARFATYWIQVPAAWLVLRTLRTARYASQR